MLAILLVLTHINLSDMVTLQCLCYNSVSTNLRLELIERSAREVFLFWNLVERENRGGRRREHGSNLVRIVTGSELKKTSIKRLLKLQEN